jgi:hypothetical protein
VHVRSVCVCVCVCVYVHMMLISHLILPPALQAACAELINGIRDAANGRHTRLVAVLLQANPLPDGDPLVEERAVSFRNACHLKTRSSLFALPSKDSGLKGMVIR